MSIREELKHIPSETSDLRSFGLVVGGVFTALWFLFWGPLPYFFDRGGNYPVLAVIGITLMVLGAAVPRVLKTVYLGWMGIAVVIGSIVTPLILTIFFFLVLTPVGLFFRLTGRDVLNRKLDRDAPTYWIKKDYPITDRSRYENFF